MAKVCEKIACAPNDDDLHSDGYQGETEQDEIIGFKLA